MSGLFQRIAVDLASGHVLQIPVSESATANHVNGDSFCDDVAIGDYADWDA